MSDPNGGPIAGVIIGSVEAYEAAKHKVEELRGLLDKITVSPCHLEKLDEAIHTLKGGLPMTNREKALSGLESK